MAGHQPCTYRTLTLISLLFATSVLMLAGGLVDDPLSASASQGRSGSASAAGLRATAAAVQTVSESALLRQVSRHGAQREEQGLGNGTFHCPLTIRFTVNLAQAAVMFTAKTSAGTIYGRGTPSYHVEGSTAYIKGSLSITQGTGRYAHAAGSRLALRATLNRHNYGLAIAVTGTLSY